jgi:NADH-quinone oxidoreductase subunit E
MSFHPVMDYGRGRHKSARALPEEGPAFEYTAANRAKLDEICARYPADQRKSAILAALYLAQHQQGYLTRNAMRHVASVIGCTPAEVEDVVSFYTMFYTRPVGRHVLQVCRTLSCALLGAERVTEELSDVLGIKPGETDAAAVIAHPLSESTITGTSARNPRRSEIS